MRREYPRYDDHIIGHNFLTIINDQPLFIASLLPVFLARRLN
jgi:hypothetical protein